MLGLVLGAILGPGGVGLFEVLRPCQADGCFVYMKLTWREIQRLGGCQRSRRDKHGETSVVQQLDGVFDLMASLSTVNHGCPANMSLVDAPGNPMGAHRWDNSQPPLLQLTGMMK